MEDEDEVTDINALMFDRSVRELIVSIIFLFQKIK